jgi:hypothetical protein
MGSTFIPDASETPVAADENNSYSLGIAGLKVNSAQSDTDEDGKIQLGVYSIELDGADLIIKTGGSQVFKIEANGNVDIGGDLTVTGTSPGADITEIDGGTY